MTNVPTMYNLAPGGGDPYDQLLEQVKRAASGVYDILGEMGRSKSGNVVYLAREVATAHLVAMKLSRAAGASEYGLEVVRTLDDSVPGLENQCPQCKALLTDWGKFCTRCGADLSAVGVNPSSGEAAQLLDAVKQATAGVYEILGRMDRAESKGVVFFARDLKRGKVVALRLQRDAGGDPNQAAYSLGETQVFRPLAAELGATQVGSYSPPPAAPPPAPAPSPIIAPAPTPAAASGPPARRRPTMAIVGGAGVLLLAIIAFFAFRGPSTPTVPPPAAPQAAPEPPPPPAPENPPPPPPAAEVGTIQIVTRLPAGARVTVDGKGIGGSSVSVAAGSHTIALEAAGFEPVSARLSVDPGQTTRWRPKLVPTRSEVAVAHPPPPPPPAPVPPPVREMASCAGAYGKSDWAQAVALCAKEADAGNAQAQRYYAKLFDDGNGVAKNLGQAASWYTRAAAGGDHEAQVRLGYMYRSGLGVKKDDRQSVYFFKLAAEGGSATGQLEYGVALEAGKGVDRDEKHAADLYRKAGAGGDTQGFVRLGKLYERGKGVEQSLTQAANLYRQAADKGNVDGEYWLGKAYKDGKGVEKSVPMAIEWFRKAAQSGHKQAADELKDLGVKGD